MTIKHKAIAKVLIARNYMQRNEGHHLGNKKVIPKEGRLRLIKILPAILDEAEELDEDSNSAGKERNAGACGTPI